MQQHSIDQGAIVMDEAKSAAGPVVALDEAGMLHLFASGVEDAEGLIAFALHRRAFLDWQDAFAKAESHLPSEAEVRHFLIGEAAPRRVKDYRERAALIAGLAREGEMVQGPVPIKPLPRRRMIWPFGPGIAFNIEEPKGPVPWRGLMLRLLMLMAAVIVSALLLRVFVVQR